MPPLIGQMSRFGHFWDDIVQDYDIVMTSPWFDWDAGINTGPAIDVSFSPPLPFQPPADVAEAEQAIPDGFSASGNPAGSMPATSSSARAVPGPAWPADPFAGASSAISMIVQPPVVPSSLAPAQTTNQTVLENPLRSLQNSIRPLTAWRE